MKKNISPLLTNLFQTSLSSVSRESLAPTREFWDSEKTLKVLTEADYFKDDGTQEVKWPNALRAMITDCESPIAETLRT